MLCTALLRWDLTNNIWREDTPHANFLHSKGVEQLVYFMSKTDDISLHQFEYVDACHTHPQHTHTYLCSPHMHPLHTQIDPLSRGSFVHLLFSLSTTHIPFSFPDASVCVCVYMRVYIYIYIRVCVCMRVYTYIMGMRVYIHIYVRVCVCMRTCVCCILPCRINLRVCLAER